MNPLRPPHPATVKNPPRIALAALCFLFATRAAPMPCSAQETATPAPVLAASPPVTPTAPPASTAAPSPAATPDPWVGGRLLRFTFDGQPCFLVQPLVPAPGNPWIWRPEFFGVYAQADQALVKKGYHVAYIHGENSFGAPAALDRMDRFYDYLRATYQLAPKVVLEGLSRGGLYAFNWAARHPDRVASLYVDAPVCDFKSWPAPYGHGRGSPADWERCKSVYGFATDAEALAYPLNPVDNLRPLAAAHLPIIAVGGDSDRTVPMEENILIVEARYRALGGVIKVIVKPGGDHHPHSLVDPTPIVDFILAHAASPPVAPR